MDRQDDKINNTASFFFFFFSLGHQALIFNQLVYPNTEEFYASNTPIRILVYVCTILYTGQISISWTIPCGSTYPLNCV